MALGKDALLRAQTLKRETVQIGPLGGEVVLRELTLAERLRCNKRFIGIKDNDAEAAYRAALAQALTALCNEDGSPMFAEDEIDGAVEQMLGLSSAAIEQLILESSRLQGVSKESLKDAVGNSAGTPSA